jgi:hypothetical protein
MHYYNFFNRTILGLLLLFSVTMLRGQDGTANINLAKDESLNDGIFSKKNGLWIMTETKGLMLNGNRKLMKFSPDLKKTEWTLDLKGIDDRAIYDPQNPDYIYFRGWISPALTGSGKKQITQVSPSGKVTFYPYVAEDNSDNYRIASFCRMNQ